MTIPMIATHNLRGALLAIAAASIALTSGAVAGVNLAACPSKASHPLMKQSHQPQQAQLIARPRPGLLDKVRLTSGAKLAASTSMPQPIDAGPEAYQGRLSDRALRERVARYRVSPTAAQRHAYLAAESQTICSD